MSLRNKLLKKIQAEGELSYGAMCQFTVEEGYKVETSGRRLRELMEDGLVFAHRARSKRNTEYIASYTAKPPEKPSAQLGYTVRQVINGKEVIITL